jgi:hypothetical protein
MTGSSKYSSIDPIIEIWERRHGLKVFRSFAGREERFAYVSSSMGETFQIAIQPPDGDNVKINVWSVETLDDREVSSEWIVDKARLSAALEVASKNVWKLLK